MIASEPPRAWQDSQHRLVVLTHVTAFAELCEAALPHLCHFLQTQFPQFDSHMHQMIAADTLLAYQRRPQQYDPDKLSLFAFLRMAARRDFLNAIDKQSRREERLLDIDDPNIQVALTDEQSPEEAFLSDAWLQEYTGLSRSAFLEAFSVTLSETDRPLFDLMLAGIRQTEPYAALLGLTSLSVQTQRQEVKRAKDRIMIRLKRFAQSFMDGS
jgi:DNA-directed RNA polymerase specialized sigma24 family protein